MNFNSSDISRAVSRGYAPNHPGFLGAMERFALERKDRENDSRMRSILRDARIVGSYPDCRSWLADNPEQRAPTFLGHNPPVSEMCRGDRKFVVFEKIGKHPRIIYEVCGNRLQKIL